MIRPMAVRLSSPKTRKTSDARLEGDAVPEGTRLLHIGPPKTGTTTLQAAFHRARDDVLTQGVRYVGPRRHSRRAVLAVTDAQLNRPWNARAGNREWDRIVGEVRGARESRLLFSSERLSHADAAAIRRILDAFDPSRVVVAATLRPLWKVMPSQWQQNVQSGLRESLDRWLERVLAQSSDDPRSFWHRNRHDRLLTRWAEAVGSERMVAVVVDETDRVMVLRTFERLLALRPGTLGLHADLANRSLTVPEVEALRALNQAAREDDIPVDVSTRWIELGAVPSLKQRTPAQDEARIQLPEWAGPRVAAIADEIVAGIEASGVRVIGDLGALASSSLGVKPDPGGRSRAGDAEQADTACISPSLAASLAMGLVKGTGARAASGSTGSRGSSTVDLDDVSTGRLAATLARRSVRRSLRRCAGAARALRSRLG
jgi:hypothetical protein